jgi:hypothetical protein
MSRSAVRDRRGDAGRGGGGASGRKRESRADSPPRGPSRQSPHQAEAGASSRASWLIPLSLALLAVLLRLPNLGWGLPAVEEEALPMKKALDMWGWSAGRVDWNPRTAGWPSLSFYIHLLLQHIHYAFGRLVGTYGDRGDYLVAWWLAPGSLLLVSRVLGVVAAGAITWVGARVASHLAGPVAACLAGGLLAISPLLVAHSQLVEPDILMALCTALAVERMVAIHAGGRVRDDVWAGLWIGLGISIKFTPIFLIPSLWVPHLLRARQPRVVHEPAPGLRPLIAVLVAAVVFALTSPFLLLDFGTFMRDVGNQTMHLTRGHFGQEGVLAGPGAYVTNVLGPGLGWGGFVLSLIGLGWAAWKRGGVWWVLIGSIVPYYLGLALLKTQFPRYMLPLLMPISLGLAGLVLMIHSATVSPPARVATLAVAGLMALAPAAVGTLLYHREKAQPSTHRLAQQFIERLARASNPHIAAEVLSVTLPSHRLTRELDDHALARLSPTQRSRLLDRKAYELSFLPMYTVQPEQSAFYYDLRHLAAHDFVIVSDAVRRRYLTDSLRFAGQTRFYRDLDRFAELEGRFTPSREARGPEIRIYRIPPDAASKLEGERGPPALGSEAARAGPLHPPDYLAFIENVARAAYAKGRWGMAARYYEALLESGVAAGMSMIERLRLMRLVAQLHQQAGQLDKAARLMETYLTHVPQDVEARASLDGIRRALAR